MNRPILVIMAAGMGSRYGGSKQMDAVGDNGEAIIDYSIFDAIEAGFNKVIVITKKDLEKKFKELVGDRVSKYVDLHYAYQEIDNLPQGYNVPTDRVKPWGTCQAVLCAKELIDGPFAVINADDYYGKHSFKAMYDYLINCDDTYEQKYAMVGYKLANTLSDNGHVARGICTVDENGYLKSVVERTRIEKLNMGAHYSEDEGHTWTDVSIDSIVSMNMWGFTQSFLIEAENRFPKFLDGALKANPLKSEYY